MAAIGSNQLLEDTVLVSERVSPERQLLCGRGVQVTRSQTTEATVSEGRVTFFIDKVLEIETKLIDALVILFLQAEIEEGIVEGTAHQVFNAKVVRAFWLLASIGKLSLVPVQLWEVSSR